MSVEIKPSVSPFPSTELSATQRTAAQQAGETVTKRGDALDQLRNVRRIRTFGPTAGVGAFGLGAFETYFSPFWDTLAGASGVILTTGVALAASRPVVRRIEDSRARKALRQNEILSEMAGTQVELYHYKTGKGPRKAKHIDLRWHGFSDLEGDPSGHRDELTKIAQIADEVRAKQIVLPFEQVEKYLPREGSGSGRVETESSWLAKTKKRLIEDLDEEDSNLVVVTPQELRGMIENIEVVNENQPLDAIMHVLQQVDPDHPAHNWYKNFSTHKEFTEAQLKRTFKNAIERDLEITEAVSNRGDDGEFIDGLPKKLTVHSIGRIRLPGTDSNAASLFEQERLEALGDVEPATDNQPTAQSYPEIEWRGVAKWTNLHTSVLLHFKNLTLDGMKDVLEHPANYPATRVTEVCEIAAWLTLHELDAGIRKGEGMYTGSTDSKKAPKKNDELLLQERIVEHSLGKKRKKRYHKAKHNIRIRATNYGRVGRSAAIIVIGAGIGMGLGKYTENTYAITQDIAVKEFGGVVEIYKDLKRYNASLDELRRGYPLLQASEAVVFTPLNFINDMSSLAVRRFLEEGGLKYTPDDIERFVTQIASPPEPSDAAVGNIAATENKPLWFLVSFNGMQSKGYWSQNVYDTLSYDGMMWKNNHPYREENLVRIANAPVAPLPEMLDMTQPLIKAERALEFGNSPRDFAAVLEYEYSKDSTLIPIPTLNGTHVAAATFDGSPVRIVTLTDGTTSLIVTGQRTGPATVEFWLAPGEDAAIRATEILKPADQIQPEVLESIWEEYLGQQLPEDPDERIAFMENFIQGFDYRLSPLPDADVVYDRFNYLRQFLQGRVANCNNANSALVISNNTELNYVTGFNNTNTSQSGGEYLSVNERHAWATDFDGQIHDATPGNVLPEEAQVFEENFNGMKLEDPTDDRRELLYYVLLGLGAALIGGAGYWKRDQVKGKYNEAASYVTLKQLTLSNPQRMAEAYEALNFVLYGGSTYQGDLEPLVAKPTIITQPYETANVVELDDFGQVYNQPTWNVDDEMLDRFDQYTGEEHLEPTLEAIQNQRIRTYDPRSVRALQRAGKILTRLSRYNKY